VKVLYEKGVANHLGPESCAGARKDAGEVLTGEGVSRVLSREIVTSLRGASAVTSSEGQHWAGRHREGSPDPARSETPCAHGSFSHGNREILRLATGDGPMVRVVNPQGVRRR
jgi:hypothetical protein